jgi:PAS domain S-box-containing protein
MFFSLFLLLIAISAPISLGFALYALGRRETPGARSFALILAGHGLYAVGYFFELRTNTLALKIVWDNIQFLSSDIGISAYLLFALEYTRRPEFARRLLPYLLGFVTLNTLMVWTDPLHHLVRSSTYLVDQDGLLFLVYDFGSWFWVYLGFTYGVAIVAIGVLAQTFVRAVRFYRLQTAAVLVGMLAPIVAGIFTALGLIPLPELPHLDITPLAEIVVLPLWIWALFQQRLLDVVPIARDSLIEAMLDGVLVVDARHRIVDSNAGAGAILHGAPGLRIGSPVADLLPELPALLGETPAHAMIEHVVAQGSNTGSGLRLELGVTPLEDRRRRRAGWLIILRDRTDRWWMEQALRESEARYRALVESSPDPIFQFDRHGYWLYINAAGGHAMQRDPEQIIGSHLSDSFLPDTVEQALQLLHEAMEHNRSVQQEMTLTDERGVAVVYALLVAPVRVASGPPHSVVGIGRDITERKQMEASLQLAHEQADAANQAKGTFLARMSHELRTPLHAMLGFAQIMARDPQTPATHRDYLQIIARSGEHLLALFSDVLDMAKIDAGRISFREQTFDLHHLLDEVLAMFRLRAAEVATELQLICQPEVPRFVVTDAGKLRQVLINLLSNAVKFTSHGQVRLRIEVAAGAGQNGGPDRPIRFTVEDTGIGIAAEDLATIFEPFTQVGAVQHDVGGTGLGLPISRRFVEILGGTLTVESTVGAGSCFSFTIPLGLADHPEQGEPAPAAAPAAMMPALTSIDLAHLPSELLVALYAAATNGDPALVADAVERIAAIDIRVGAVLTQLETAFDYGKIRTLLQPIVPVEPEPVAGMIQPVPTTRR